MLHLLNTLLFFTQVEERSDFLEKVSRKKNVIIFRMLNRFTNITVDNTITK